MAGPERPGSLHYGAWGSCGDPRLDAIAEELFPLGQVACADLGHAPFEQLVPDQPMVCNVGAEDETWSALPGFPNLSWLGDPLLRLEAPRPTDDGGHRLLVERGDQRALLTIHPLAADPGFRLAADGRLRVHRKEVAGYVVHELSGSATPLFLDRIDAR